MQLTIPGFGELELTHLLLDFNGTLAKEGILIPDVKQYLQALSQHWQIHVLTGDTFGTAKTQLMDIQCQITILPPDNQCQAKANYLAQLGAQHTVAIGNGRNDRLMLKNAKIGIAVLGQEGTASEALLAADLVAPDILIGLNLLQQTRCLTATLRS